MIKPTIFICDFEPLANYAAFFMRIPCISIDNQHEICFGKLPAHHHPFGSFITKSIIKMFIPKAEYFIIATLQNNQRHDRCFFFAPLLRKEVKALKPKKSNFVLVYLTSSEHPKLWDCLKKIEGSFIIYGSSHKKKDRNLLFKPFHERAFLKDLSECKAAILSGGLAAISECAWLKKPVLVVPFKLQFEQIVNGLIARSMGYGGYMDRISAEGIREFLSKKHIPPGLPDETKKIFRTLERLIDELSSAYR